MTQKTLMKWLRLSSAVVLIVLVTWVVHKVGVTQLRAQVDVLGVWAPLGVLALRFTSVLIPALPGTAYSILAGDCLVCRRDWRWLPSLTCCPVAFAFGSPGGLAKKSYGGWWAIASWGG